MKQFLVMLIAVMGLSVMAVAAEDATGTWKATFETPNGSQVNTFVFKMDGSKVTGTISSDMMGTQQISDGKVDGDKITFSFTSDFGVISYSGTIKGDTMKLTLSAGNGQFTVEVNASRVKA
jgi:hypothetical protein